MTAAHDWEAHVVDIVTAFLHVLLKNEPVMYLRPPQGYETYDEAGQLLYWLLLRALYGLKQSNRLWYIELTQFLTKQGYHPLPSDPCVL